MSNTRNGLLAQIVAASGGAVRNESNRNMLLEDWLNAVSGPATRQVFNFNGVDQYIQLTPVDLSESTLELTIGRDTSSSGVECIFSGLSGDFRSVLFGPQHPTNPNRLELISGAGFPAFNIGAFSDVEVLNFQYIFSASSCELFINGVSVGSLLIGSDLTLSYLASRDGSSSFFDGLIYNLKINNGSVYNYPVDDGWPSNPVIRNTGSGPDATLINGLESGWETINV